MVATAEPARSDSDQLLMILSRKALAELQLDRSCCWQYKCFPSHVDTVTDGHRHRTEKDSGSGITGYRRLRNDVPVKVTQLSRARCAPKREEHPC
jgi:hypothetical protein